MGGSSSKFAHPVAVPPSVDVILKHRDHDGYGKLVPPKPKRDAPIVSLYRMYAAVVCAEVGELRKEIDYFWNEQPKWHLAEIPDPNDNEPDRYAILAALSHLLLDEFRRRFEAGEMRGKAKAKKRDALPAWVEKVPDLEHELKIPDKGNAVPESRDGNDVDPYMLKKNILTKKLDVFTS